VGRAELKSEVKTLQAELANSRLAMTAIMAMFWGSVTILVLLMMFAA